MQKLYLGSLQQQIHTGLHMRRLRKSLWDHKSNLNPVNYAVWSVLQERVYRTKISDVDELKRIHSEGAAVSHTVIERAVGKWRQCLCACIRAGGRHFEYML